MSYWTDLPADQQAELRKIAVRFSDLIPAIGPDGTVPDLAAAKTLLEIMSMQTAMADEFIYWTQLSNEVLQAHADWLSRTRRMFESRGIPWTTEELARRAHLWEHE